MNCIFIFSYKSFIKNGTILTELYAQDWLHLDGGGQFFLTDSFRQYAHCCKLDVKKVDTARRAKVIGEKITKRGGYPKLLF